MKLLRADRLAELAAALAAQGYRVIAPIRQGRIVRLAEWRPGAAIETAGISANSVKDFLFPRSEIIDRYSLNGGDFVQRGSLARSGSRPSCWPCARATRGP